MKTPQIEAMPGMSPLGMPAKPTTPGPWRWDAEGGFIVGSDHTTVCEFGRPSASGVRPANARLIAAAPELHRQLKALCVQIESAGMIVPPGVTNAIAKAEGAQ